MQISEIEIEETEIRREIEEEILELEGAYRTIPHVKVVLAMLVEAGGARERELRDALRRLSLLCFLLRRELAELEEMADKARKRRC